MSITGQLGDEQFFATAEGNTSNWVTFDSGVTTFHGVEQVNCSDSGPDPALAPSFDEIYGLSGAAQELVFKVTTPTIVELAWNSPFVNTTAFPNPTYNGFGTYSLRDVTGHHYVLLPGNQISGDLFLSLAPGSYDLQSEVGYLIDTNIKWNGSGYYVYYD